MNEKSVSFEKPEEHPTVMDALVVRTLKDLLDDYERQDNLLYQSDVDRLIEKRALSSKQSLYIYQELSKKGIDLEIEDLSEINSETSNDEKVDKEVKNDRDLLGMFLKEASKAKLLSREGEIQFGRAINQANEITKSIEKGEIVKSPQTDLIIKHGVYARDMMIKSNIKLVISIAKRFKGNSSHEFLDLIQEGTFGLIRAIERFDHTKGFKLSTYATWWIRQSISRAINNRGATIRIPVHMMTSIRKLNRARNLLRSLKGKSNASLEEMADFLGWTVEKTTPIYLASLLEPYSLDAPISEDGDITSKDLLVCPIDSPDISFERKQLGERLDLVMTELPTRQIDILKRRFGFNGEEETETLQQIANDYRITRERIRQLESKALDVLRKPRNARKVSSFLDRKK